MPSLVHSTDTMLPDAQIVTSVEKEQRPYTAPAILLALVITGFPLVSFVPEFMGLESRIISVPFRALVLIVAGFAMRGVIRRQRLVLKAPFAIYILFWIIYLVRLFLDTTLIPINLYLAPEEYLIRSVGMCFIPATVFFGVLSEDELGGTYRLVIAGTVLTSVLSVVWLARLLISRNFIALTGARLGTEILNPISLGHVGATLVILLLYGLVTRRSNIKVLLAVLCIALGLSVVMASASKGPILAVAMTIPFLVYLGFRSGIGGRTLGIAMVFTVLAIWGAFVLQDKIGFGVITRFETALDKGGDQSGQVRGAAMTYGWEEFMDHPLTGNAIEEPKTGEYPHNLVIESFMATGIVGGTLFVSFILTALFSAFRILTAVPEKAWVSLLFFQYFLSSLVSGSLYQSDSFWCLSLCVTTIALYHGLFSPLQRLFSRYSHAVQPVH